MIISRGKGTHLGKVLPHHMQGPEPEDLAVLVFCHEELLDSLIVGDLVLIQQHPLTGKGLDHGTNDRYIWGPGWPDANLHSPHCTGLAGLGPNWSKNPLFT